MATPQKATFFLTGLAQRLVREGILDDEAVERIHDRATENDLSFFAALTEGGTVDTAAVARCAALEFGMPMIDVGTVDIAAAPVNLIQNKLVEKLGVLPLYKRGTKLFVGIADPTNAKVLDDIKFHTGLGVEPILCDAKKLHRAIEEALDTHDTTLKELEGEDNLDDIDMESEDDENRDGALAEAAEIDTPIVRFVNKMMLDAIKRGASDIHMEPYETKFRIRFRVDGVLHEIASPPVNLAVRFAARVKILSRLDIAEKRVPQDGRMKLRLSRNRAIDFRVSTLPTLYGEKVVIRLLDAGGNTVGIEGLGFNPEQKQQYLDAIDRPYGMILVTGPTGSGKTVTLYTGLGILNTAARNVSTVEDPVEINLSGINQVNINERANLTFSNALRAFLRQDPDVIMIGEIRDLETADIAIKASQTGHLVLSTLHTNDAPSTLTRMLNMGVAPFNIASAVHLILAQRLVRKLCDNCKKEMKIPEQALLTAGFEDSEIEDLEIFGPVGCDICTAGYRGRSGIFQAMPITEEMGSLIMRGCTQHDIEMLAKEQGVIDLRRAGLDKVKAGITSLEEVERVTNL